MSFLSALHGSSIFLLMGCNETQGRTLYLKIRGAGWIVWGLGFWLGKDILGFFKNSIFYILEISWKLYTGKFLETICWEILGNYMLGNSRKPYAGKFGWMPAAF